MNQVYTQAQVQSIYLRFERNPDGADSFPEFLRRFTGNGEYVGGIWCGMFLGVERDGYAHT